MAEPVIVPVQLEVTDIDMSAINFGDVQKDIAKKMSAIKQSINDAFKGIDPSAINKPIESAMTSVKKSVQAAEDAQLRYREALIKAGASTEEYKTAVSAAKSAISNQASLVNELSQLGPAAAPFLAEAQKELDALIEARNKINPLDFVDKASPIQLEKVANAYKKVLSAVDTVNSKSEKFNQTTKDNRLSDDYSELVKKAETYKKKLEELDEKSKRMEALGATDKQWEALRYDTEQVSNALKDVITKMRTAVKTGKAFRLGDGPKGDLTRQISSFAMSERKRIGNISRRADANQSPYTEDYQKSLDELDKLEKKIEAIQEKSARMVNLGSSKKQFESIAYDAEQLDIKVDEVKNHLMGMVNEGGAFKFNMGDADAEISKIRDRSNSLQSSLTNVSNNAKRAQGGLTALGATHPKLAGVLNVALKIGSGLGKVLKVAGKVGVTIVKGFAGAVRVMGNLASSIARVGKSLLSGIRNMSLFGKSGRKTSGDLNSKFKKLGKNILMWGLGFRTAYYAIKRLRNIFVEGFKVMGDTFSEIGEPMKEMITSFNRLKGSLATAFQPLVSVLMPILTRFMNYLSAMLEAVGKFGAVLTGQGHIYKAVAKDVNSVSTAAKNANKELGSYDKLEVVKSNNVGYEYEKQDIGATESAASNFANMVKEAWKNANFTGVGQYVTEQLLNILDNVEKVFLPKVTGFVNKVIKSINTFLDGFDSKAIGDKLGSILNKAVSGLDWTQIGMLFANLNNVVWEFFDGLVNNFDWATLGESLATGITTMFSTLNLNSWVGMVGGLVTGIVTALVNVLTSADWTLVATTLGEAVNNLLTGIDWAGLATSLANAILSMFSEVGTALAGSNNPLISSFGEIILTITDVIKKLRPAVTAIISAIWPIVESILPVITELLPPIAEIISEAVVMVMPVLVSIFQSLMPILTKLIRTLLPVVMDILKALQPLFDVLTTTVLPFLVRMLNALMPSFESILNLITSLLEPLMSLLSPLIKIVFHILDPIITILEPILATLTTLCNLIGEILRPILEVLTPILEAVESLFAAFEPIISVLLSPIKALCNIFQVVAGILTAILVPSINVVMKIIEALATVVRTLGDVFTGVFNRIKQVISDWGTVIKNVLNSALGGIETFVNGLIRGINNAIKALNALSFTVPDWVPKIGGNSWGFQLKEIKEIKIPRLAQGAVIPPNKEFLAMLGDQKSGTNIEAPLDTIKQALAEVLAEIGGGSKEPIVLQLDGRTVARVVWNEQEKRYKQTGKVMA